MSVATAILPQPVDGLDMAFGRTKGLLPPMSEIPDEFKRSGNRWVDLVSIWFFLGLKDAKWKPKAGIDTDAALKHVAAIMASFEPQHEHKSAGCAYLLSLWFDDVTYKPARDRIGDRT